MVVVVSESDRLDQDKLTCHCENTKPYEFKKSEVILQYALNSTSLHLYFLCLDPRIFVQV